MVSAVPARAAKNFNLAPTQYRQLRRVRSHVSGYSIFEIENGGFSVFEKVRAHAQRIRIGHALYDAWHHRIKKPPYFVRPQENDKPVF